MTATRNHIGKTIYVSAALPATNDATGFEALSWTKAAGVQQLPQLGITHAMTEVPDLESGFTKAVKGAGVGRDSEMTFRTVASDSGQGIIKTAAEGDEGVLSVKIVRGSGASNAPVTGDPVQYAQGIAHSYVENQGNDTNHEGFTAGFRQNEPTIDATEPA